MRKGSGVTTVLNLFIFFLLGFLFVLLIEYDLSVHSFIGRSSGLLYCMIVLHWVVRDIDVRLQSLPLGIYCLHGETASQ